jgi:hypothetical protein
VRNCRLPHIQSGNPRIGVLDRGWSVLGEELHIAQADDKATVSLDAQGRHISFGPLAAGEERYSLPEQSRSPCSSSKPVKIHSIQYSRTNKDV